MKTFGFLLRVFIALFASFNVFSCNCFAARLCPVREVRVFTPESVKCVCEDVFFGDKCQFRVQNSLAINASWTGINEARVQWETGLRSARLLTRKVNYDVTGSPIYGKWKAGVQSRDTKESHSGDAMLNEGNTWEARDRETVKLRLDQAFSWELRLIQSGNKNKSAAIFIDSPMVRAFAFQNNTNSSNSSGEERCPWYECPERTFAFINFFQDFNKPCFKKGIIIGVVIGCIATVIISASVYMTARICIYCCGKKKCQPSSDKDIVNVGATKSLPASVAIAISEMEVMQQNTSSVETQSSNGGEIKRAKSCVITMTESEMAKSAKRSRSLSI